MQEKQTAADFIRQHPTLSAPALVALGAEHGIKIGKNHVHTVRYEARRRAEGKKKPKKKKKITKKATAKPSPSPSPKIKTSPLLRETLFKNLAFDLGMRRSLELLKELSSNIR